MNNTTRRSIIECLSSHPKGVLNVADLAEAQEIDESKMHRLCIALFKEGLVTITKSLDVRIAKDVRFTTHRFMRCSDPTAMLKYPTPMSPRREQLCILCELSRQHPTHSNLATATSFTASMRRAFTEK